MAPEDGVKYLNFAKRAEFIKLFLNIVEHTPKVAEELYNRSPFENVDQFLSSLRNVIESLSLDEKIQVLAGHPDLAGRLADENLLTPESTREQSAAGLHLLTADEKKNLKVLNDSYRDKFGFTFVICARENKAVAIQEGIKRRLQNNREEEIKNGIDAVQNIAALRAVDILTNYSQKSKL